MKNNFAISVVSVFLLFSCNNSKQENSGKNDIPKVLNNESSSIEIINKRGRNFDLVEELYNDQINKIAELQEIENRITQLKETQRDSTATFEKYDSKNQSYFHSADEYVEQISDSLLKKEMKAFINASLKQYNSNILKHSNLMKEMELKTMTLSDLHIVLKLTSTMPVIEKYQKENKPSTKPIEGYNKEIDKTINALKQTIKK